MDKVIAGKIDNENGEDVSRLYIEGQIVDVNHVALYTWAMGELITPSEIVVGVFIQQQMGQPIMGKSELIPSLERVIANLKKQSKFD